MSSNNQNLSILRRKDVENITKLSRSSIYALIEQGKFPKQIRLSQRSVGWLEHEIQAWLNNQIAKSRHNHE